MSHRYQSFSALFDHKKTIFSSIVGILAVSSVVAQPAGVPAGGNVACAQGAGAASDTVIAGPDSGGFRPIFNGSDFKGWWESCQSSHSTDKVNGGIWIVDKEQKAIFSNQTTGGSGSILMTNKVYSNYELVFDFWPDFGNDAGIFNRTSANGKCYQTVLDYIDGSSVAGAYGEGGYNGVNNIKPFSMGSSENTIKDRGGWAFTGSWSDAWDLNGWNQIRIEAFGNPPRVRTYMKKLSAASWIPVLDNTSTNSEQPSGYIGLQIHQGTGRWSGRAGNWYRNIKMRPLTAAGVPIPQNPDPTSIISSSAKSAVNMRFAGGALIGSSDLDYQVVVKDLQGRKISSFSGKSGSFSYAISGKAQGVLVAEILTSKGAQSLTAIIPPK